LFPSFLIILTKPPCRTVPRRDPLSDPRKDSSQDPSLQKCSGTFRGALNPAPGCSRSTLRSQPCFNLGREKTLLKDPFFSASYQTFSPSSGLTPPTLFLLLPGWNGIDGEYRLRLDELLSQINFPSPSDLFMTLQPTQ